MRKYLLILFLIASVKLEAQITWKKNFLYGQSGLFSLTTYGNSGLLMATGNGYFVLDSTGHKMKQKIFTYHALNHSSDFDAIQQLVKINETKLAFDGFSGDTCFGQLGWSSPGIFIVDTAGNYVNGKHYRLNGACPAEPKGISLTSGNGFIETGFSAPVPVSINNTRAYVIRVDSSLAVVWAKHFNQYKGGAQFAKELPDKSFIIGLNLDSLGTVVGRTDSMGNFIWCKSFFRPKGILHKAAVNDDGTFVVVGYTDSVRIGFGSPYPPGFDPAMFMLKLDTSGTTIWCKTFDTPHYGGWGIEAADIKKTPDGGFILTGTGEMTGGEVVALIKTDSNGDTLWTSWHGDPDYLNFYQQVFLANDGGYLVGGMSYGYFPQANSDAMYLFKLDSLGHGSPCSEHFDTILTGTITVNDSDVVLTSIDGAVALPANLLDTVYPPFPEYDHCQILNIPVHESIIDRKMKSYPNPTTGKVTIKAEGTTKKESTLTVYDSMGKLILKKPYRDEKDMQLDLSKYGKGVYFIKVYDGDKTFDSKVVVQ